MKQLIIPNIYEIIETYKPDNDLFTKEEENILLIKNIIYSKLSESDRRIILLYAHYGNLREVAKILKVSVTTAAKHIKRIRININSYFK